MSNEIQATEKKSAISIGTFQGSRALTFNTLTEIHSFATMVTKTDLVPKGYRGKPEDATVAIIYGMEIGLPPLSSLQNISVVNGTPAVWGDAQLSLVQASGKYEYHKSSFEGEGDNLKAIFEVKRIGSKEPVIKEFSVADAKKANLWGKAGTWSTHPKVMLSYKARAFALREAFADILKGMHSAEEMEGEIVKDVTPSTSKTANAHLPPKGIEEAFKPAQTDIEEFFKDEEVVVGEVVTDNDEVAENAFKKVSEGLKSMANAKGLNTFFDYSSKDELDYLKEKNPAYYAELVSIKNKRLEELNAK